MIYAGLREIRCSSDVILAASQFHVSLENLKGIFMRILVAYMSVTGNTKKVAEAIYDVITEEKEIRDLKELESLEGYDLIFLGFPIHDFGPPKQAKSFIEKHAGGKTLAMFVTHGAPETMEDVQDWLATCKIEADQCDILGIFNCQGEIAEEILDFIKGSNQPKLQSFAKFAHLTKGLPNEEHLNKAKDFASKIVQQIS